MRNRRFGQTLVRLGKITEEQLEEALEEQKNTKQQLGDILFEKGWIRERDVMDALEEQLGIPQVSLHQYNLDSSIVNIINERMAVEYLVLPLKREGNILTVAMADPTDYFAIDNLRIYTGLQIEPVIASRSELKTMINRIYSLQGSVSEVMELLPKFDDNEREAHLDDAPVSRMVNQILQNAVMVGASDIHFDPHEHNLVVRYRIDGTLQTEQILNKNMQSIITTRIKIMSDLNISERRLPQDGRFRFEVSNREIDVRVSTLPTVHGEKVVLRILDLANAIRAFEELGLSEKNTQTLRDIINRPYGLMLVSGPTGSGKTSTLYAALNELNKEDVNIITIEDPVEYQLKGINQIQVNERIGLSFITGLRTVLRQDPDIIMVGEVRDAPTVEMAIRSALTGHIVLSTIHTNDAPATFTRLLDMGVEPYVVVSALTGIVAQRLVRKICPDCITTYEPTVAEQVILDKYNKKISLQMGTGCSSCLNTGYKGRIALYEIVVLDEQLKRMIINRETDAAYREYLESIGFVSMFEDGLDKIAKGITTMSEVLGVSIGDEG